PLASIRDSCGAKPGARTRTCNDRVSLLRRTAVPSDEVSATSRGAELPLCSRTTCAPATLADCGSRTLTLISTAKHADANSRRELATEIKRKARLLFTRKGLVVRFAPVSWLCEQGFVIGAVWADNRSRTMPPAFPEYSSDRLRICPLTVAGSAGFTPASQSSFEPTRTREPKVEKELKRETNDRGREERSQLSTQYSKLCQVCVSTRLSPPSGLVHFPLVHV